MTEQPKCLCHSSVTLVTLTSLGGQAMTRPYVKGTAGCPGIRLPDGLWLALELAASRNGNTVNREITERLEASVRTEVREGVGIAHRESRPKLGQ